MGLSDFVKQFSKNFNKKAGESVLGVDISSSTIKVVQLRKEKGRAILETYGELALGPYVGLDAGRATSLSSDKITAALKDLLIEAQVTTKNCGVAIPISSSLINIMQMPDVGEKKLKEMVPIEVRKYIPVNISEVLIDWRVIPDQAPEEGKEAPPNRVGKVDVLLVAIHKDIITKYQSIIQSSGLQTSFFEIEVFSTIRSVLDSGLAPSMIIDFGAGTTKIFIVDGRVLRESHTIPRGAQDITVSLSQALNVSHKEAEEMKHEVGLDPDGGNETVVEVADLVLDNVFAEAHRVMLAYQKERRTTISKMILTGGGATLKGIMKRAEDVFHVDVALGDPFAKAQSPAFLENVLQSVGPEFAVAFGVALRKLEEGS